ncbi:OmpA family protein [Dyadobacter sandarakinus]|uniref:OmpA family protein n=1 Tax=Dyadobacter sandarakinus TaxID=2747268 RepID=A0ABX7I9N5_9BACT|nr:OmpA family protein [Dyadobacter sandarakinus]QRR02822.1 OmpA family protein [Dyadobacter sandarakinus]
MNPKLLSGFFCFIWLSVSAACAQVTENPKVEEQSATYVKIKRVELTDSQTIIHLQFTEKPGKSQLKLFGLPDQLMPGASQIWLDPETRLYKPGEIEKKFKLIKAENIPTDPTRKNVAPGETVNFVAYFERLTPGIEIFDFYEGRSSAGSQSWNFYGIHITNPEKKSAARSARAGTKATPPAKKPVTITPPATPAPAAPDNSMAVIRGTVFNAKTRQPVSARISYVEKGDSLEISSSSGKYRVGVDPAGSYELRISAKGFYGQTVRISPADSSGITMFDNDIYLAPLTAGETVNLPNIYFETSKFTLLPESFPELDRLVGVLKDNPSIRIRVEGHTDNVGDFDKNLELSRKRAESVRDYLTGKGVSADRIEAKGYGATRPLTQGSAEERKKNRRVEFVILDN